MRRTSLLLIVLMACLQFNIVAQSFEAEKIDDDSFKELKVRVGADFAIQLQSIDHEADVELIDITKNFNLPTANMGIHADLAPGVQLSINTFLSSRHHNEAWVEGGYLTMDKLPFLPAADDIMESFTIKAGVFNPNYGDAHFYRSNNAAVTNNPFVGNWIMDSYTTNPGLEILFRNSGIIGMIGANNGRLNYGRGGDLIEDLVFNWKAGYDTQLDDDMRLRATVSGYHVGADHSGSYLWDGDRAGARYYNVMQTAAATGDNFRSGRWSPGSGQTEMTSIQANVFFQVSGLELFGIYETMSGVKKGADQKFTQTAFQAIYRLGDTFVGGRWNSVSDDDDSSVSRINIGAGWSMLDNVLLKLDYVSQSYEGAAHGEIDGGKFNGLVFEAAISF